MGDGVADVDVGVEDVEVWLEDEDDGVVFVFDVRRNGLHCFVSSSPNPGELSTYPAQSAERLQGSIDMVWSGFVRMRSHPTISDVQDTLALFLAMNEA